MSKENLQYWENWYDNPPFKFKQVKGEILDGIINDLNIMKQDNILDIGFGQGELLLDLAKRDFINLYGTEISNVAVESFSKEIQANALEEVISLKLVEEDKVYGFNKRFKIVFCNLVYALINNKKDFLNELKFILDKDGIFIIYTQVLNDFNKEYVKEKALCIDNKDIEVLSKNFINVESKLLKKTEYGDGYLIFCYK